MGSIIWNNKQILEFNNNDRDVIVASCNSTGIKYNLDKENILLFPSLTDKTIILRTLSPHDSLKPLVKQFEEALKKEGAAVIHDEGSTDKASLEYLDSEIFIGFSLTDKDTNLMVYLPFEIQKTSTYITKHLLKQLTFLEAKFTYKVADFWNKLKTTKYWSYLFGSSTPTIILDIGIHTLKENLLDNFVEILLKAIIEELGYRPSIDDQNRILNFLDSLNQKVINKDILIKEQIELDNLINKLASYESELEGLKQSISTENAEETEKINTSEKNKKVEDNSNIKSHVDKQNKQIKYTSNKKIAKIKADRIRRNNSRDKKIYLPMKEKRDAQRSNYYPHLAFPLRVPGEGPVHQFQRPSPNNGSMALPPRISPRGVWNSRGSNQGYGNQSTIPTFKPTPYDKEDFNLRKLPYKKNDKGKSDLNNIYNIMYP
ncbi:hypothetical protein [Alkaliphilus peptidifermentans]|uniref:Uncharacterized protein n=1 Tax=Alkaliphilus peptidifermentans DSM 18978 TaxID=1120976 RepID=A0A1G5H1R4_9FIRM|nr:hypothetical protein [Alkaliphilus peptidifermentans]SCY57812.1 hypothetical protein SAMN03080606_01880 [Alkaliphilus peptidifermentans DSM 18978]